MSYKITINASSSFSGVEYSLWQNGVKLQDWQSSNEFTVANSGTYTIKCRDSNGCTAEDTVTL